MDRWGRLAWVAARQHGVVTLAQALEHGISADALQRRAREQRWARPFPGVYVMPGHPGTREAALMAGTLFLGDGALVARRSAAALWGLIEHPPTVPEFLLPHGRRVGRASGLVVLRTRTLVPADATTYGHVPVTSIDRTLCDLAAVLGEEELREAVALAGQRSLQWPRRAAARAAELPRLPGRAALLEAIRDVLAEGRTDSTLERRIRRILRGHGLRPAPGVYPLVVKGRLVAMLDIAFPELRLAVEVDGFAFHATPSQLRADRARQNRIAAAGWTILRIAAQDIAAGAPELVNEIAARAAAADEPVLRTAASRLAVREVGRPRRRER